jgi:hypothetical protein
MINRKAHYNNVLTMVLLNDLFKSISNVFLYNLVLCNVNSGVKVLWYRFFSR